MPAGAWKLGWLEMTFTAWFNPWRCPNPNPPLPVYLTLKPDVFALSVNPDVEAMVVPKKDTMLIAVFCQWELSMGPVVPLMVAWAFENCSVPKLANGKMPDVDDGVSTIHSAEDRTALLEDCIVENVCFDVLFVMLNKNDEPNS